jgi:flap endonuclease-1
MGIKDLLKEIKARLPGVQQTDVKLYSFRGCKIGFDVSIYAWAYMYAARGAVLEHQEDLCKDPNPRVVRSYFLENYMGLIMAIIECEITPVPVFDGPAFRLKQDTHEDRQASFAKREADIAELRFKLAEDPTNSLIQDDLRTKLQSHVTFSKEDWEALEELMISMGLPVVKAKYEAEAVCARLYRRGLVAAVMTNDGDCLAHGAGIMIRNVKRSSKRGKTPQHTCSVIILDNLLAALHMRQEKFIEFCMLLGCDYVSRMYMCGWVAALKHLKAEGSLEGVVAIWKQKGKVPADHRLLQPDLVAEIKGYFRNEFDDCIPDFPLVVNYTHGLGQCFDTHFVSWTRDKLKNDLTKHIKTLEEFNQKFAALQKFLLVLKEDVDTKQLESKSLESL